MYTRNFLFAALILFFTHACAAQITIDSTGGNIVVTEKQGPSVKTLRIYRSYIQGKGKVHKVIYQPDAADFGNEAPTLHLVFSTESAHIRSMLDAAVKKKQLNFSQFSMNLLPYTDLTAKLADIYAASPEWNEYLKRAGELKKQTTLDDGTIISEIAYDNNVAAAVLEKSDLLKPVQELFTPYGYKLTSGGFPDEHQQILSSEDLTAIGKNGTLFIPVPNNTFVLTKVK